MKQHIYITLLTTLALTACGEFAYKRGATATDLQQAKLECSKSASEALAETCMKEKGWSVQKLDDVDLFATVSYTDSNPNQTPSTNQKTTINVAEPSNKTEQAAPKKEADPLDLYTINSWWKMGANGQSLEVAINECEALLGEAHKPNSKTQQVTRGLVVCMREKGWRGLKVQN
ncbi:MAG: hypothetical protein ACKVOA_05860 [Methylophilaceae bacterium]